MQRIGQHQTAFSIGINHFNGFARHCSHNITRTLGVTIRHVFNKADDANNISCQFPAGNGTHCASDCRRTAHIPFHIFHAFGRLYRNAARIKGDALSNKGKGRFITAAFPIHHHHEGVAPAALSDPQKGTHSQLFHRSFVKDFDLKPKRAKRRTA